MNNARLLALVGMIFVVSACKDWNTSAPVSHTSIMNLQLQTPLTPAQIELQQQRIELLTEIIQTHANSIELGIKSYSETVQDSVQLIQLKLTLATTAAEQKALLQELHQVYTKLLEVQKAQYQVGILSINDYKHTQVKLLEVQMLQMQLPQ